MNGDCKICFGMMDKSKCTMKFLVTYLLLVGLITNKYLCPFEFFFDVNHHNQTIVFATVLVENEMEETYV